MNDWNEDFDTFIRPEIPARSEPSPTTKTRTDLPGLTAAQRVGLDLAYREFALQGQIISECQRKFERWFWTALLLPVLLLVGAALVNSWIPLACGVIACGISLRLAFYYHARAFELEGNVRE